MLRSCVPLTLGSRLLHMHAPGARELRRTSQWESARTTCARVPWRDCSRHSSRTRSYSCAPIAQCCALRILRATSGWHRPYGDHQHWHHQEYKLEEPRPWPRPQIMMDCRKVLNPDETNEYELNLTSPPCNLTVKHTSNHSRRYRRHRGEKQGMRNQGIMESTSHDI